MTDTAKLIDRLEQILPGIQNSNSSAEDAMVEVLPEVIAALKAERDAMAEALKLAKMAINCVYEFEGDPSCCGEHLEAADEAVNSALGTHHNEALESSK